jgi:hypothetical protein
MMRIKEEVLHVDRIRAMSEQLIRFIMNEILDPKGKFHHDSHPVHRESASTS